jgi:hypothetical protein
VLCIHSFNPKVPYESTQGDGGGRPLGAGLQELASNHLKLPDFDQRSPYVFIPKNKGYCPGTHFVLYM